MSTELPPMGHCRRWVVITTDSTVTATWCAAPGARLYPLGWRCKEHRPTKNAGGNVA